MPLTKKEDKLLEFCNPGGVSVLVSSPFSLAFIYTPTQTHTHTLFLSFLLYIYLTYFHTLSRFLPLFNRMASAW